MFRMLAIVSLIAVSPAAAIDLEPCDQQAVPEIEKRLECLQRNIITLSTVLNERVAALNKEHEEKFVRYGATITIGNVNRPGYCLENDDTSNNTYYKAFFGPCGKSKGGLYGLPMQQHVINR
jgi:hypothetical protein